MKKRKTTVKFLTLIALVVSVTLSSCSSDDDIDQGEELSQVVMKDFAESINKLSVPSGLSSSTNQYAQQANAQFTAVKNLGTSFAVLFNIPANATSSKSIGKTSVDDVMSKGLLTTKTYTWSSNGTTVEYTISESSDRYTFSYTITAGAVIGKIMDGYQLKDGSYAEAKLYSSNILVSTIKWWVNANTTKIEIDSDTVKMVLESNLNDNSGSLNIYESSTLFATYTWNASGSGTFTNHATNESFSW